VRQVCRLRDEPGPDTHVMAWHGMAWAFMLPQRIEDSAAPV